MKLLRWDELLVFAALVGFVVLMMSCFTAMDRWQAEHGHDHCDRALARALTSADSILMYSGHWSYCIQ